VDTIPIRATFARAWYDLLLIAIRGFV